MRTPLATCPAIVNGQAITANEHRRVLSPFDGRHVGDVAWVGADVVDAAIDAAHAAMQAGLATPTRAAILDRLADALAAHRDELAGLLALEIGKPIRHGRTEVERAVSTLRLSAVEARKLAGHVIPMEATDSGTGKLGFTVRVPVGVVGAITPFNFPLNLACHKLGPALAAGCAVVIKPADKAPLTVSRLVELASDAGLPPGWLNLVVGDPERIVAQLSSHPHVGLITFTGSAEIGWSIRARAPRKRVTLELGNVTPVIIDEGLDPHALAGRLAGAAFGFSGQSCISVQRLYAHESIADDLGLALANAADAMVVGDPSDESTDLGPVITQAAAERLEEWIEHARDGGASLLAGGGREGQLVRPTVVAGAPAGSELLTREAFGPVVCVQRYRDFEEALDACNSTSYGLHAGIFTTRIDRAFTAARRLDFGGVLINELPTFRADQMPYGGVKDSGNSREGPAYAIREMTHERLVVLGSHALSRADPSGVQPSCAGRQGNGSDSRTASLRVSP